MLIRYVAFILLLWLGPSCLAQTVTVRLINANNGHPLQNQSVAVSLLYEKGEATPAKYDANLSLLTDVNGEVRFVLPEPPPAHLAVQVKIDWARWHCGCNILAVTQDVMHQGVVDSAASAQESRRSPALVKAVPGEIRFVARPLSFFERLLGPLLRQ